MQYFDLALRDGHAALECEGTQTKVVYRAAGYIARYTSEEHTRAEYWAELIYKYGYDPTNIGLEVPIRSNYQPSERIDLLVYTPGSKRRPFIVVECKSANISALELRSAQEQVRHYAAELGMTAGYAVVVASTARSVIEVSGDPYEDGGTTTVADLPVQYGQPKEFRFYKGVIGADLSPASRDGLLSILLKCQDAIWGGGFTSRTMAFSELCKLLSLKLTDEATCSSGQPYHFQTRSHETDRTLSERIRALADSLRSARFEKFDYPIRVNDATLRTVVAHLEGINISATPCQEKTAAFDALILRAFEREPYLVTELPIIRCALNLVRPRSDEAILDPACGTGGFLTYALERTRTASNSVSHANLASRDLWQSFARSRLFGIDIDKAAVGISQLNLMFHEVNAPNVHLIDSLSPFEEIVEATGEPMLRPGMFDVVVTNPPSGVMIDDVRRLEGFSLVGEGERSGTIEKRSESLFIERAWQFLKPGGRAALVLPYALLRNKNYARVRQWILERYALDAVVSLPYVKRTRQAFNKKGCLVIMRKRIQGEPMKEIPTFMAEPVSTDTGDTLDYLDQYLSEVTDAFCKFLDYPQGLLDREHRGTARCFALRQNDLTERFDPEYFRPEYQYLEQRLIKSQFPIKQLGEVVSSIILGAATPKESEFTSDSGAPVFVRVQDVRDGRLWVEGAKRITLQGFSRRSRFALSQGDVVLTIDGSKLGAAAVWPCDHPACISNHLIRLVPGPLVMSEYLTWFLNSELGMRQIQRLTTHGLVPTLRPDAVTSILVPVPPLAIQAQIVREIETAHAHYILRMAEITEEWDQARRRFSAQLIGWEG